MMMRSFLRALPVVAVLSLGQAHGQGVVPTMGKEFWLGFMQNYQGNPTQIAEWTLKGEAGLVVVIEVDRLPGDLGAVAADAALLAEQRLAVHVLVAGRAVGGPVGQAEHRLGVAAVAGDADVLGL